MGKLSRKEIDKLLDEASSLLDENLTSREYRKALSIYKKVLKLKLSKSDRLLATEHKGIAFWGLGDKAKKNVEKRRFYRQALKCFEEVIRGGDRSPHVKHCKKNKWYILEELGDYNDDFYTYLDLILSEKPRDFEALWYKAEHLEKKGKFREAAIYYLRTIKAHKNYCVKKNCPNELELLNNIGSNYGRIKKHKQALRYLNKALKISPKNKLALFNKGNALFFLKNSRFALYTFNRLLKLRLSSRGEPKLKDVLQWKIETLLKLKKYNEADNSLDLLTKIDRKNRAKYYRVKKNFVY